MAGGVDEPDRIVGATASRIGGGDVAVFGELASSQPEPVTHSPGLTKSDLGLYAGDDFSDRSGIRELDAVEFLRRLRQRCGRGCR